MWLRSMDDCNEGRWEKSKLSSVQLMYVLVWESEISIDPVISLLIFHAYVEGSVFPFLQGYVHAQMCASMFLCGFDVHKIDISQKALHRHLL